MTDLYTIDPFDADDELFDMQQAAAVLARLAKRDALRVQTVYDYARFGVAGVRLPVVIITGKRMTSRNAIRWWLSTTTRRQLEEAEIVKPRRKVDPVELERARALGLVD